MATPKPKPTETKKIMPKKNFMPEKGYPITPKKSVAKPASTKYNFEKEAAKFIGGAAKANMKLPGEVVKIIKMHGSQIAKDLKKGYNKK